MFSMPRNKPFFAWLIAVLMAVTQTFAAVHGVVHADRHLPFAAHHHAHEDGDGHHHSNASENENDVAYLLSGLFSSHESESDCRLYDQARGDGVLLNAQAAWLPPSVPTFIVASFEGKALARWAALFDARGPPLTI